MKINISKIVYGICLLLFCLTTSWADTPEQELVKLLNDFRTMHANFSQTLLDSHGNAMQKSQGIMAISRPGKFHWEITSPNKQLLIADGKYIWIYDEDLKQATRQPITGTKTSNPASLLSDTTESLQQRFIVTALPAKDGMKAFQLKPKTQDDMFQWIRLYFRDNALQEMRLADNLGQLSVFQFSNVILNQSLNPSLFQFKPARGVDVITQ